MSDAVEDGAAIAWRLLATLEGGSLVITLLALSVYTIRSKLFRKRKCIKDVLVTNINNRLGRELKEQLENHKCNVATFSFDSSQTTRRQFVSQETRIMPIGTSDSIRTCIETSLDTNNNSEEVVGTTIKRTQRNGGAVNAHFSANAKSAEETKKFDALIVIGADLQNNNLDGMTELMTKDVYENLKVLESESHRVRRGGYIAWACAGATSGGFGGATCAYDAVLLASLRHIADISHCEPIWVGRCVEAKEAAHRIVSALIPCTTKRMLHKLLMELCLQKA